DSGDENRPLAEVGRRRSVIPCKSACGGRVRGCRRLRAQGGAEGGCQAEGSDDHQPFHLDTSHFVRQGRCLATLPIWRVNMTSNGGRKGGYGEISRQD